MLEGKYVWIWNLSRCDRGRLPAIVERLKSAGCAGALVKAWDGVHVFDQATEGGLLSSHELAEMFHENGLKIATWGYCYGQDPAGEAAVASVVSGDEGTGRADAIVLDVEAEYKHKPDQARVLCTELRRYQPDVPILYSSFAIAGYHRTFPFDVFTEHCDGALPQVYWNAFGWSVVRAVSLMYRDYSAMGVSGDRLLPVAGLYKEGTVPYPTAPDVMAFIARAAGTGPGCSFWSYEHMNQEMWDAVAAIGWPVEGMPWTGWKGEEEMADEHVNWLRAKARMVSKLLNLAAHYRDHPDQDVGPEREVWVSDICPEVYWRAEHEPRMRPTRDQCRRWAEDLQTPE